MKKDKDSIGNNVGSDELKELDDLEDTLEIEDLKKLDQKSS